MIPVVVDLYNEKFADYIEEDFLPELAHRLHCKTAEKALKELIQDLKWYAHDENELSTNTIEYACSSWSNKQHYIKAEFAIPTLEWYISQDMFHTKEEMTKVLKVILDQLAGQKYIFSTKIWRDDYRNTMIDYYNNLTIEE